MIRATARFGLLGLIATISITAGLLAALFIGSVGPLAQFTHGESAAAQTIVIDAQ